MAIIPTTPSYEGAPATGATGCGDLFGWLFGFFAVPTPAYESAEPSTSGGGTPLAPTAKPLGCDTPIVVAPTGPVTIVLGADVQFAQ